jgi:hypothetical protein
MNKFIHIVSSPFSQRDYDRYGVAILEADGFDVEVWNIGKVVNSDAYEKTAHLSGRFKIETVFDTKNEFLESCRKQEKAFFFVAASYAFNSLFLFKELSRCNHIFSISVSYPDSASIKVADMDEPKFFIRNILKFFSKFKNISFKKISDKIILTMPPWLFGIKHADLVFSGGDKSRFSNPLIGVNTRVVNIHANDYDIFLENPPKGSFDDKYAVFIDQNLPFNTDPFFTKSARVATARNYFPSLTKFFAQLEKDLRMPIKIAVHPRANLDSISKAFGGRELLQGETASLVNDSSLVIAHYSNAVNFAVLYRKPLIFITTDELNASFRRPAIEAISSHFKKDPINVDSDKPNDWNSEMIVDSGIYDQYIFNFIKKPKTPERFFWQVVGEQVGNY